MALTAGTRLGPYDVLAPLGAGGMGEVYRASDPKLQRQVAIKALPPLFAADPERVARFEREAQALAALNHPGIAGIYELLEHDGQRFLVLELVEGETLAARLQRGPLPLDEALPIARQIAEALEAAHDKGIVHRDLKPANIALTPEGGVKLLDFGLAKASDQTAGSRLQAPGSSSKPPDDFADSPTFAAMTQSGVILGTAAYMSPEQARGKPVDRRADIWAFGCVLFEMLTGTQAFGGETVSDVIGALMRAEPEWSRLPADVPPVVQRLLRRCLVKDPRARLPHIGLVRLELDEPREPVQPAAVPRSTSSKRAWAAMWAAVITLAIAAGTLGARLMFQKAPSTLGPVLFDIEPPEGTTWFTGAGPQFAVSPDGRTLSFLANGGTEASRGLWVRSLSSPDARLIQGTSDAVFPFWSPDGRELAFFSGGALKKVSIADGTLTTLSPAENGQGGTWGVDGTILFAPTMTGAIWRVSSQGGAPQQVTTVEAGKMAHRWPYWTDERDWFLYIASETGAVRSGRSVARLRSMASGEDVEVIETPSRVTYAAGHLFFAREAFDGGSAVRAGRLFAQALDVASRTLQGDPRLVAQDVAFNSNNSRAAFHVSGSGVIAFKAAPPAAADRSRLVWRTRQTNGAVEIDRPRPFVRLSLSPDGTRAVAQVNEGTGSSPSDLWMYDLSRGGVGTRFTVDAGAEQAPAWSPDGRYVAYSASAALNSIPEMAIWIKPAGGVEPARLVAKDAGILRGWTPDGKAVITVRNTQGTGDIWLVPIDGGSSRPLVETPFHETDARFSPDGRWLAYTSDENNERGRAGQVDVFVQPYPPNGQRWRATPNGGHDPNWSSDSRELYFTSGAVPRSAAESVFAVPVLSGEPRFGLPKLVLENAVTSVRQSPRYAVSPDGRFLLIAPLQSEAVEQEPQPLTVLLNWPELVRKN